MSLPSDIIKLIALNVNDIDTLINLSQVCKLYNSILSDMDFLNDLADDLLLGGVSYIDPEDTEINDLKSFVRWYNNNIYIKGFEGSNSPIYNYSIICSNDTIRATTLYLDRMDVVNIDLNHLYKIPMLYIFW